MLKIKLFRGFAVLVILFSVLSGFVSVGTIKKRVVEEAQTRVRLDLTSARHVLASQLKEMETVVHLLSVKPSVLDACEAGTWDDAGIRVRLEKLRIAFGFDFLGIVSEESQVVLRAAPPYATGDYIVANPVISLALKGKPGSGISLLSKVEMQNEADGLSERAFLELRETRHARMTSRQVEDRGMVIVAASPVEVGGKVLGAVYGGVLVNRNHALVDEIHNIVYDNETYKGMPLGTATIFLGDTRISTTVCGADGNRALATRVSKEVADQVLDNGTPWIGEAFVVKDWYLTAYEPIRDGTNQIIGMLYVGILRSPFEEYGRLMVMRYIFLSLFVLLVALALAFVIAGRLAGPIHRLVEATNHMRDGNRPGPVSTCSACHEVAALIHSFNEMASTLHEREDELRALNTSYMETLGFVSHELKSPVATIMNYVYLMRQEKLGPLSEGQAKAVKAIETNSTRLVEMVRHYLNLSRIENRELDPVRSKVSVWEDVLSQLIDSAEADLKEHAMRLTNTVDTGVRLYADLNMVREVFENMLSNAVKYGRDGGAIDIAYRRTDGMIEFSVRNEGDGIPAEKKSKLFQKFSRLDNGATARRQKGTGLGLFITKHIIDVHGGTIRVESEPGAWVTFIFTFQEYREAEETANNG